jgi:hypothetical protein
VDALLDLAFVLRCPRPARGNQEAVVLRALAIGALYHRVVEHRLDDRRLEVIDDDSTRDATEPLEGPPMAAQPRGDLLVEDELDITLM